MSKADTEDMEKFLENDLEIEMPKERTCDILTPSSKPTPEFIKLRPQERHILLRDQLDVSSILNGVDKNTGKANFMLPLIGLPSFAKDEKVNFYYNGNNKDSSILGIGWSFPLSFILMDHQGSIFPENERFYLVLEDIPQLLIKDRNNSTEDVYTFKLPDEDSETQIHFFKKEERWEVVFRDIKRIYGTSISRDLSWENWRGTGSSSSGQIELTTAWYLNEIRNEKSTSGTFFDYVIENVKIPGRKTQFTREVYLSEISDMDKNILKFNYEKKNVNEYTQPSLIDKQGNYNTKKVQTRFLASCELKTSKNYIQNVQFIYKVKNGIRLLTEIKQSRDPTGLPILTFSYGRIKSLHTLEEVTLPTGARIKFSYRNIGSTNLTDKKSFIHDIPSTYRIDYAQDFSLMSYFSLDKQVVLRIFDRELKNELLSTISDNQSFRLPNIDSTELLDYQVKILNESFVIILYYRKYKNVLHGRRIKGNNWRWFVLHTKFTGPIDFGTDFIIRIDEGLIKIDYQREDGPTWITRPLQERVDVNTPQPLLRAYGKVFYMYDDYRVYVGYRNKNNDWHFDHITTPRPVTPNIIDTMSNTFKTFGIKDDEYKLVLDTWPSVGFQIRNNFILFSWWSIKEGKIYSNMELLTLNSAYQVADVKTVTDVQENLMELLQQNKTVQYQDYFAYLHPSLVKFVKKTFIFNGFEWELRQNEESHQEIKKSWSIPIDDKFVLGQDDSQSPIKLYKKDKNEYEQELLDLGVKNISQVLIKYPNYLIYETENQQTNLAFLPFLEYKGFKSTFVLPREETLSLTSNFLTLVSHAENSSDKNVTLIVRQFSDIASNKRNTVITKLTVEFDDISRDTGYDYDESTVKAINDMLYYGKTFTIPGNKIFSFGYIEEANNFILSSKETSKVYDAGGNEIKILQSEQPKSTKKNVAKKNEELTSILLDKSGNLEVAQFYPYEMQDDEIGYYGFEYYEAEIASSRWIFDSEITNQEFSLTGQNLLKLSNSRLLGTFQPRNQNQNYVASCWVRSPGKVFEIDTIAPILQAAIITESNHEIYSFFSTVKFHYDDWNYLEVVIDLFYAKEIFNNLETSSKVNSEEESFKILVSVDPGISSTLHVDHIRFSPLNSNFQATTYDYQTKEIKEIINSNGLIKRYLYNDYQDQITSINESGEIKEFNTYTKSSSIHLNLGFKSKIQIKSNGGRYENFNPFSFNKWWNLDEPKKWEIGPGQLFHKTSRSDQLTLKIMPFTLDSYGIRLHFSLESRSSGIEFSNGIQLQRVGDDTVITHFEKQAAPSIPPFGEILFIVEGNRLIVWIDGGLYFDQETTLSSVFYLHIYGEVRISDMLLFSEPSVQVTYFNALNEKVQEINLESKNSVYVTEFLYDELGRQTITTKPTRVEKNISDSIVAYYFDFVRNKNPLSDNSVWKIHQLQGIMIKPYDFYQVTYKDNPLNEESAIGLPGQEFSVEGQFAKRFSHSIPDEFIKVFINKHYPADKNYRYVVENKKSAEEITIFDNKNNKVAWLLNVPGKNDYLATYKYNDDGKLVQALSPLYHEKVGTLRNLDSNPQFFNTENNYSEHLLKVQNSFDEKGNIITASTADSGKVEYLYNDDGLLKFTVYYSIFNSAVVESVVYFDYDHMGRLNNTGKLITPPTKEKLNLALKNNSLDYILKNNTEEYQVFYHNDFEKESLRGRIERSITYNDKVPFIEESLFNENNDIVSKRIVLLNSKVEEPLIIATNKIYQGGKVREIEYPFDIQGKPVKIIYSYDKLNRIKEIGVIGEKNYFAEYTYNSNGYIETEHHLPNSIDSNFTRKYSYNSASFLTQLQDKFLTENIYYTEGSYSGSGYGDGTISRTEFDATWHNNADSSRINLNENSFAGETITPGQSKLCFDSLKEAGYINQFNRQEKIYYPLLEVEFPTVCNQGVGSRHIENILGKQGFPSKYGHLYDYGAYQELIKAKYFVGEKIPTPLQPDTFAQIIPEMNVTTSRDIWNILTNNGFIIPNMILKDVSYFKLYGKQGTSFIRSTLRNDLKTIDVNFAHYRLALEKILVYYFSNKQDLSLLKSNLKKAFFKWSQNTKNNKENGEKQEIISKIVDMLEKKGYLNNPLDEMFKWSLKKYESIVPEIVKILFRKFSEQIGEAEFDFKAYATDENGNHKHYYNGFERYELQYRNDSNQIDTVIFKSFASSTPQRSFSMKHDSRGNVIQALHKGIRNISYHSVSNHATSIELVNGKEIIFYYDAQGERVLKRVLDIKGEINKEIHYIRDEFGRSLVEREMIWSSSDSPPSILVTLYVYGPKGIIGFIRRNEYYSVITDHAGSIRLVVKDGEVVAAYDYLPYGNLMRQYARNSEAHISYRFTGQEWDEEVGLYNYHARLYDPSIGRYYQHDPKMQYFSPYKYASNSPVSTVDPNGEFAFLIHLGIALAAGLIGAYLAGSAANGNFNPLKWQWNAASVTQIALGFVAGFVAGWSFVSSAVYLGALMKSTVAAGFAVNSGIGLLGGYLVTGSTTNEWNPAKWDFKSPELWYNAYMGFLEFGSIAYGVKGIKSFTGTHSFRTNLAFAVVSGTVVGGVILKKLSDRNFDFSQPGTYWDISDSIITYADIFMYFHGVSKFFKKNIRKIVIRAKGYKKLVSWTPGISKNLSKNQLSNSLLFRSAAKIIGGITISSGLGLFMSAALNDYEFDFTSWSTYESFIFGIKMVPDLKSLRRTLYKKGMLYKLKISRKAKIVAEKSVKAFKKIQNKLNFVNEIYKLHITIQSGDLPKNVIVVMQSKNKKSFVAYSGTGGPGLLPPIPPLTYPQIPLGQNGIHKLEEMLKEKQKILRETHFKDYKDHHDDDFGSLFVPILAELPQTVTFYFDAEILSSISKKVQNEMNVNGYIGCSDAIVKIILSPIAEKVNLLSELKSVYKKLQEVQSNQSNRSEKLLQIEKTIVKLEESVNLASPVINTSQPFNDKLKMLNKRLAELLKKKNQLQSDYREVKHALTQPISSAFPTDNSKSKIDIFWDKHFKKYFNSFAHWTHTTCATPQVVSLRSPKIISAHENAKDTLNDIRYSAAYTIKQTRNHLPSLEPTAYTANCSEETSVKNMFTDPEWENMVSMERNKLISLITDDVWYLKQSNFFLPYYNIVVDQMTSETKDFGFRKKRSISGDNIYSNDSVTISRNSNDILKNHDNKSDYYVKNEKPIIDTKKKSTTFKNNLYNWMKTSIIGLLDTNRILPGKASTHNTLSDITNSSSGLTAVTALVDVNSTLLLLDTVLRKVTGQKHIHTQENNTSLLEATGYSLDVGLVFEKTIKYAALKSGISMHRFNIHYIDIQEKVIDKIMSGKLDEIAKILISHAEVACPQRQTSCPGKLSRKKFEKFIDIFSKRIYEELNEVMQKNKTITGS